MTVPNWLRLVMYLSGLAAVGYIVHSITGDPLFAGAFVIFARWLKPFSTNA